MSQTENEGVHRFPTYGGRFLKTCKRPREAWTSGDIRNAPAYAFPVAARHLGMPPATLRSWVLGRTYRRGRELVVTEPLIRAPAGSGNLISFNNLVEAHALRAIRTKDGVRMAAVRDAIRYAEESLGIERLLLSDELRTSGQDIFLDRLREVITLSRSGQLAMKQMLSAYLKRVDRDDDARPFRLYPLRPAWSGDRKPIVIDPRVSFGRPTVAGSGVSTAALVDRVDAGEDLQTLADDYHLSTGQVEDAVFYELAA